MREEPARTEKLPTTLADFVTQNGLIDVWRQHFPIEQTFTHVVQAHVALSRLDYLFASSDTLSLTQDPTIHDLIISDHSPVSIQLVEDIPKGSDIIWRYPFQLKDGLHFQSYLSDKINDYKLHNAEHDADPILFWEAAKACIRGHIIAYSALKRKDVENKYQEALARVTVAHKDSQRKRALAEAKISFDH